MIQYSEFIDCVENRSLYCPEFRVRDNTLEGLLNKLRKSRKYNRMKQKIYSICIDIESLDANNFVFLDDIIGDSNLDIPTVKRFASGIARSRHIYISPDLSKIYSETILANNKDSSVFLGVFDYSLMYGNYDKYTSGCLVKIPLFKGMYRNNNNGTTFKIDRIIHDPKTKIVTKNEIINGIYCIYEGVILDDAGAVSGWIEEADIPIPVSLFKPIKG